MLSPMRNLNPQVRLLEREYESSGMLSKTRSWRSHEFIITEDERLQFTDAMMQYNLLVRGGSVLTLSLIHI